MGNNMDTRMDIHIRNRIDSFNYGDHNPFSIKQNEKTKDLWDIDETKRTKELYNFEGDKIFRIRTDSKETDFEVIKLLDKLGELVKLIKEELCKYKPEKCIKLYSAINILIITPHFLGEMPLNDNFDGLNKPKKIVKLTIPDGLKFKRDTPIRAGYKLILLKLRNKNGSIIKPFKKTLELITHELAHTMCNHVTFRQEGNHEKDFHDNEKTLKVLIETNDNIQEFLKTNFGN